MIRSVPFELFAPNQCIYFDIARLAMLEKALGEPIPKIIANSEAGITFCLHGLTVGLKHHYAKASPQFFAEKLSVYFESGGSIEKVAVPIIEAIVVSGIFGKVDEEDEKNAVGAQSMTPDPDAYSTSQTGQTGQKQLHTDL